MKNIVLILFGSLFVFFICLLFAQSQGYYKTKAERAKVLTDEQIVKFEKDVENGKKIDVKDYVLYKDIDYTNKFSKNIYKVSLGIEDLFDKTVKFIFERAASTVND